MTKANNFPQALKEAWTPPTNGETVSLVVATLTPDDALDVVTQAGVVNRNDIDWSHVGMLADMMQQSEWLSGSQISLLMTDTGQPHLVGGNHRLYAAHAAGFTGKWVIRCIWDNEQSAEDVYQDLNPIQKPQGDDVIGRALGHDQLSVKMQEIMITVGRYTLQWDTGYQLPELCHTPPIRDIVARIQARLGAFEQADEMLQEPGVTEDHKSKIATPMVMAVVVETIALEPEEAVRFWRAVFTNGDGIAGQLRQKLLGARPSTSGEYYEARLAVHAWEQHSSRSTLQVDGTDRFNWDEPNTKPE